MEFYVGNLEGQIAHLRQSLGHFGPELFLCGWILVQLLTSVIPVIRKNPYVPTILSGIGILITATLVGDQFNTLKYVLQFDWFMGMIRVDGLTLIFKLFAILSAFGIWLMTLSKNKQFEWGSEFYFFLSVGLLGMLLLSGAVNLLMIFLCLEIISLISYLLTAYFKKPKVGAEAAVKYFIYGSVSSAIQLYGISLLYGISGTLEINDPGFIQGLVSDHGYLAIIAILFWGVGLAFKLVAVPFHFWSPDVYAGVPATIASFLANGPKLIALVIVIRFSHLFYGTPLQSGFQLLIACVAILSMFWGNLGALRQHKLKRLLAYSGIAHTGYWLSLIACQQPEAETALIWYGFIYLLASSGAFIALSRLEYFTNTDEIRLWTGIGKTYPWTSASLVICLAALGGLPPTAGFFAKINLLIPLFQQWQNQSEAIWLALLLSALFNTLLALYYYLSPARGLFLKSEPTTLNSTLTFEYLPPVWLMPLALIILGIVPLTEALKWMSTILQIGVVAH